MIELGSYTIQFICRPNHTFHFGNFSLYTETAMDDTAEIIHSDVLFSALINVCAQHFGPESAAALVAAFASGEVTISSAYYFLQVNNKQLLFFPKPATTELFPAHEPKDIRRIRYVSGRILQEGILPERWNTEECVIIDSAFVCLRQEIEQLLPAEKHKLIRVFRKEFLHKVKVHKEVSDEDRLYSQINLVLCDNSALKLGVHFWSTLTIQKDFVLSDTLLAALALLKATGIGGERSTLDSSFEDIIRTPAERVAPTGTWITLSLLHPMDENQEGKYYRLLTRGGRRTADAGRLKAVRMISEGMVARTIDDNGNNPIISNTSGDSVVRYGMATYFPIHPQFYPEEIL